MLANNTVAWPMFFWCSNGSVTGPNAGFYDATNSVGIGIGGFNDWYIPAKNEMEILYRNLKPTATPNTTTSGANANAVPSATSNYTAGWPVRTTNTLFQSGGAQAFSAAGYWTATEYGPQPWFAMTQNFSDGNQVQVGKSIGVYARAIRRVAA
jgi:hypothetical protein